MDLRARWPRSVVAMLLASSAGALGAAALTAGPAHAAPTVASSAAAPHIDLSPMAPDGSVHVVYTDPVGGLDTLDSGSLRLIITWHPPTAGPAGAPQPPGNPSVTLTGVPGDTCTGTSPIVTCDYPFPPGLMFTSDGKSYILNGTYQLQASAQDCVAAVLGCTPTTTPIQPSTLVNPPTAPTGVSALLLQNPTAVKVSWKPSPEPDVAGYRAFRADGSVACRLAALPAPTDWSCVDTSSGGGKFAYHVVAYRWGGSYADQQKPSAPSGASPTVTVPGPPAVTTTTVAGGLGSLAPPGFNGRPSGNRGGAGTGFFSAQPAARAGGAPSAGVDMPASGDTGFQPVLPYGRQAPTSAPGPASIAAPAGPQKGKTSVGTIAVVGAGLLIAVIALHGLWLRSEVRRSTTLEPLEPET